MRYLVNKESIVNEIVNLLNKKNLLNNRYTFFDAFCGTGTVSDAIKNYFDIILNDNLLLATTFSKGRIISQLCNFVGLRLDPFEYFNNNNETRIGFFSQNYAPSLSGRMYFSDYNAGRIDYFREQIEEWKNNDLITIDEYSYLLGCLLESVSKVANVAGVYGAYLKSWDPRAIKEIVFLKIETTNSDNAPVILKTYNSNLNEIINDVDCDILYLDPPYTKNKYSVQYHLLETLVRNDNPQIKGITGGRHFNGLSDNWSKKYYVEVEFEKVVKNTRAKHILMSYSSDGIMSKDYISNILKRYGKPETFELLEINYKKYRNYKTKSTNEHYEYIFYIEKKPLDKVEYCCPLNYMGGKTNVVEHIKPELNKKHTLIDLMAGGFNVGINGFGFNSYIYNDINFLVKSLVEMFKTSDTVILLKKVDAIINKYGLTKHGQKNYIAYRNEYNNTLQYEEDKFIYLFTLILYGFQQQIRFNSKYEFNNPIGESGYNESIKEKIVTFSSRLKELNVSFQSKDFSEFIDLIDEDCLVYIDPPYLITLGSYNDGKRGFNGWNDAEEKRLIAFLDAIKIKRCKILISNILNYKEKENRHLKEWIIKSNAKIKKIKIRGREEVLVIYE
ncbi:MAG: DNA adenine methylase [Romboutsia sp.]|nr:DNA adenine methylase [Romboutsia sp.]